MKRISALVVTLGIAAASLSSCSRSNYAFNSTAPAQQGSEQAPLAAVVPADAATAAVVTMKATAVAAPAARPVAAPAAKAAVKAVAAAPKAAVATDDVTGTIAKTSLTRAERKVLHHQAKQATASHQATKAIKAGGKSQLIALILALFVGFLGIHRFYLGYTGIGILELLTFGVFGILSLIDLIRIIIGDLKPKDGEYEKTL